jgi:hypothetical protein
MLCLFVTHLIEQQNSYRASLVHSKINDFDFEAALYDIMTHVGVEHIDEYCFTIISVHSKLYFASSFLTMLHMYIAHKSRNIEEFQENLMKLLTVGEVVQETKSWIADLLSSVDVEAISRLPQWLHQLINSTNNIQQPISINTKISNQTKKLKNIHFPCLPLKDLPV